MGKQPTQFLYCIRNHFDFIDNQPWVYRGGVERYHQYERHDWSVVMRGPDKNQRTRTTGCYNRNGLEYLVQVNKDLGFRPLPTVCCYCGDPLPAKRTYQSYCCVECYRAAFRGYGK